jgi:adenylate cyclase
VPLVTAIAATAGVVVLLAIHLWVTSLPGLDALEGLSIDARFRVRGPRPPETDRVVIVGLDDDTRARYPDVMQTRHGWARLIDTLTRYDVKVIALDLFYSAPEYILPDELAERVRDADARLRDVPSPPPATPGAPPPVDDTLWNVKRVIADVADELRGDQYLADSISASKRVFLGAFFRPGRGPARDAEPPKLQLARHGEVADAGGGGRRRPTHATTVDFTLDTIGAGAIGAGALNSFRDPDGVTRRTPLAIELGGRHYMPLGLAVALYDLGHPGDTRYLVGADSLTAAGRELPVGIAASASLDVLGRGQIPRISAAAVLAGTAPKSALAGKLVFVGLTYASADKITTPLDAIADGVELHATLAENVLSGRVLRLSGPFVGLAGTLALCGVVVLAQLRRVRRRAWVPPVAAVAAIGGYLVVAYLAFRGGTVVPIAAPITMAVIVLAAATIGGLATEGREKANLRAVFSRYVSRTVVDRILADPARAKLGGERKELTVLFSDIRGFSAFAEGMGPEALASFLGEYLTPMTELVLDSGGTLDKYIGDAVMAIWAAPVDTPDHAARACDVALRMQDALVGLNAGWRAAGKPQIAIGIGINTGAMAVGNMGTAARFDYTVLGDQVNLGARLEALTKDYGVGILVGEATARAAGAGFVFREIDVVRVKGRAGAAPVFELVGRAGVTVDPRFGDALAAYRKRDFATARHGFAALADDPAAAAMATRCAVLADAPPPEDWDGVYEQRSK